MVNATQTEQMEDQAAFFDAKLAEDRSRHCANEWIGDLQEAWERFQIVSPFSGDHLEVTA